MTKTSSAFINLKLENSCSVLQDNRYPETVINISIREKIAHVNSKLKEGSTKNLETFLAWQNFS